jgi:hypothetical protein
MTEEASKNKIMCHECDQDAKWIVEDLPGQDEYFLPLCEEHFQETVQMEGEINLDFQRIEDLTLKDVIGKANAHNKFWHKRYENLLKEFSALKKSQSSGGSK